MRLFGRDISPTFFDYEFFWGPPDQPRNKKAQTVGAEWAGKAEQRDYRSKSSNITRYSASSQKQLARSLFNDRLITKATLLNWNRAIEGVSHD
jgi:hypothetical protein